MNILVIIPAKLDSKRLPNKNILEVNGKTLVEYSIGYALQSRFTVDVILSSEDILVKDIADKYNVLFHLRSKELCGDTEVVDVYIEVVRSLNKQYDLVVGLQPDNPDRSNSLDECISYMLSNNYDDLVTVNSDYKRSGSVRIFKYQNVVEGKVSKRLGCIKDVATDIHYLEDLQKVKERL
jgi:CMP-N,N'-diacetyllegionaminic acid synthase